MNRMFFVLALLASFAAANVDAQVRGNVQSITSGPCFAQPVVKTGWTVRVNFQYPVIFTESDLLSAPFTTAALGTPTLVPGGKFAERFTLPILGCTPTTLMVQVYYSNGTTAVIPIPFNQGAGQPLYISAGTLATANPLPGFVRATGFAPQGERMLMVGDFSDLGGAQTSKLYDITFPLIPKPLFDFGLSGIQGASIAQSCATNQSFWFGMQMGSYAQIFRIDGSGNIRLAETGNGWQLPTFACGTDSAFGIPDTSSIGF